jgi:hypothetical protein
MLNSAKFISASFRLCPFPVWQILYYAFFLYASFLYAPFRVCPFPFKPLSGLMEIVDYAGFLFANFRRPIAFCAINLITLRLRLFYNLNLLRFSSYKKGYKRLHIILLTNCLKLTNSGLNMTAVGKNMMKSIIFHEII